VEKIASVAIEDAVSRAQNAQASVSGSGFGVAASSSFQQESGEAESTRMTFDDGRRSVNMEALEDSVLEVTQEWKGGTSGASVSAWRDSLDESTSSNWRVIDRVIGKCTGLWTLSRRPYVRQALCDHWLAVYMAQPNMPSLEETDIPRDCSQVAEPPATEPPATTEQPTTTADGPEEIVVFGNTCSRRGCGSTAVCPEGRSVVRCREASTQPQTHLEVLDSRTCNLITTSSSRTIQVQATCSRTHTTQLISNRFCPRQTSSSSPSEMSTPCPQGDAFQCFCSSAFSCSITRTSDCRVSLTPFSETAGTCRTRTVTALCPA